MKMSSLERLPILHRLVSKSNNNLLRISILLTKMKKPMIIHKLIVFKKSRKLKKFKLLKHYNYGFLGEYQFDSPPSTPLIHYYNRNHKPEKRSIRDIYSMLFWSKCFGCLKADQARGETECRLALEADNYNLSAPMALALALAGEIEIEADEEEDDSVDERAQRFIENFYAEMRLQRQESF